MSYIDHLINTGIPMGIILTLIAALVVPITALVEENAYTRKRRLPWVIPVTVLLIVVLVFLIATNSWRGANGLGFGG